MDGIYSAIKWRHIGESMLSKIYIKEKELLSMTLFTDSITSEITNMREVHHLKS
jgi:hypothetical protein